MKLSAWRSWGVFAAIAMISLVWSVLNRKFEPSIETDSSTYTAFDWSTSQSITFEPANGWLPAICCGKKRCLFEQPSCGFL